MTRDHEQRLKRNAQVRLANFGPPAAGEIYQHYKGGFYTIVASAVREDSCEPAVIYRSNARGTTWERTLEDFTAMVEVDGSMTPRFRRWET